MDTSLISSEWMQRTVTRLTEAGHPWVEKKQKLCWDPYEQFTKAPMAVGSKWTNTGALHKSERWNQFSQQLSANQAAMWLSGLQPSVPQCFFKQGFTTRWALRLIVMTRDTRPETRGLCKPRGPRDQREQWKVNTCLFSFDTSPLQAVCYFRGSWWIYSGR